MSTWMESPGLDQPQMVFGFPRWRTMLSPNIGLTNGSEEFSGAAAASHVVKMKMEVRSDFRFIGLLPKRVSFPLTPALSPRERVKLCRVFERSRALGIYPAQAGRLAASVTVQSNPACLLAGPAGLERRY